MLNIPESVMQLLNGDTKKNFRVKFPNGERADIVNENIVSESMELTESICSQYELKYGLCESSCLKFVTMNVESIKGCVIDAFIEIDVSKILNEKTEKFTYSVKGNNSIVLDFGNEYIGAGKGARCYIEFDKLYETNLEVITFYKDGTTSPLRTYWVRAMDMPVVKDISKFQINFDADENSPELPNTISVSSDFFVVDDSNYQTSSDVPFPFYRIKLGRFTVKECKKQADMTKRNVIAYSDTINSTDVISPFEKMKLDCPVATSQPYVVNPVLYAIENLSRQIKFDFRDFDVLDGITTLRAEFEDTNGNIPIFERYPTSNHVSICATSYYKKFDLMKYKTYNYLFGYNCGAAKYSMEQIDSILDNYHAKYESLMNSTMFDSATEMIKKCCNPYALCSRYNSYTKGWIANFYSGSMKNEGFFIPFFPGYGGQVYQFRMPYKIVIEARTNYGRTVLDSQTIELYDKNLFDVGMVYNEYSASRKIYIPTITTEIPRAKNTTGEYIVDQQNLPVNIECLKAFLELNGSFLKVNRSGAAYDIIDLQGIAESIYPSEDLYPSELLFPGGPDVTLSPSDYYKAWYDDEYIEPYTEVFASYVDKDGNNASASEYEKRYREETELLLTQSVSEDSERLYIFNLTTSNPLENGQTLRFDVSGLTIFDAWIQLAPDVPIEHLPVSQGDTYIDYTYDWKSAKQIHICIDSGQTTTGVDAHISKIELVEEQYQRNFLDVSQNYLIKNFKLSSTDVANLLHTMLTSVRSVTYMPAEIELKGLPYIEPGDIVSFETADGEGIETVVLRRTLKGIQALRDTFESN